MSNKNKIRYSILLLLVIFFVLLQYSIYLKNSTFLNVALSIYLPVWVICVLFEIIRDIKLKGGHNQFGYYFAKYVFFIIHSLLLCGLITKSVNTVRPDTPFSLFTIIIFSFFYPLFVLVDLFKRFYKHNNEIKDNLIHIYWIIAIISVFNIFEIIGIGSDIDELVLQDREKIINHYQGLCSKQYCYIKEEDRTIKDKNNMFSQKYRVRVFHNIDNEKCVSISNTYFDPNLYISKCGNKEIEVNYLGEKL